MLQPGRHESKVTVDGADQILPNALVVSLGTSGPLAPGDVLLTVRADGSMGRALVTDAVRGLAHDVDAPATSSTSQYAVLRAKSVVIESPGAPGSTVACRDGKRWLRGVVIVEHEGRVLSVGYAGRLRAHSATDCVRLAIKPGLQAGQRVWGPRRDTYTLATVDSVSAARGKVVLAFGAEKKDVAALDVAPEASLTDLEAR